ncbi:MAG: class I SAM-dependent methyltransferase [Gammaproteobacteria bacterium]|nr:class I SAM-dependent methyltransferase [Gammaproteobacteria bacterium]
MVTDKQKCLDIGCGKCKTVNCVGVDRVSLEGVDVVHNLDQFPWPFKENSFDVLFSNHFLEHVDDILGTLAEIHRIAKPNARVNVRVPHYASDNFHSDLTHKVAFGYRSFDHFSINERIAYDFYSDFKFEILHRRLKFMGPDVRFDPFKWLGIEALVNLIPRIYERFFVYFLPPVEIQFQLRVIK